MDEHIDTMEKEDSLQNRKFGKKIKNVLKYIVVSVIVITTFIGLLVLSSLFPRDWIQKNQFQILFGYNFSTSSIRIFSKQLDMGIEKHR